MSLSPGSSPPESPITPDDMGPPSPGLQTGMHRNVPSIRSLSDSASPIPTPLATLNAARRPERIPTNTFSGGIPKEMQARLAAFHASRNVKITSPTSPLTGIPPVGEIGGGATGPMGPRSGGATGPMGPRSGGATGPMGLRSGAPMGTGLVRPIGPPGWNSAPEIPGRSMPKPSMAARRGLKLPGGLPGTLQGGFPGADDSKSQNGQAAGPAGSLFNKYADYVDAKTGTLKFAGKAVIHGKGVDFSSGSNFSISLDEIDKVDELGKGNYGTVYKVIHRKPRRHTISNRSSSPHVSTSSQIPSSPQAVADDGEKSTLTASPRSNTTNVVMAMKEIRLELDEAKFAQIIMELDVLHKCRSPFIIEFYGAFFQEGAVYICIEYMDGGSIDKLYKDGVPEGVLRKITYATVQGLKTLKDDHNIIHRDVKPTNILINTNGEIKLCDFGVSGNLVASIAKTNIGCQSYMAPERIANGGMQAADTQGTGTYSVQSDIWSLGLSILECAMGCYPYPPETYNNIFSQLSAIVDGQPPDLPEEGFSIEAHDFVRGCLNKIPKLRPTYAMLLNHPWISNLAKPTTIAEVDDEDTSNETPTMSGRHDKEVADWVIGALDKRSRRAREGGKVDVAKPALHAAPLDAVASPALDKSPGLPEKLDGLKLNGAEAAMA